MHFKTGKSIVYYQNLEATEKLNYYRYMCISISLWFLINIYIKSLKYFRVKSKILNSVFYNELLFTNMKSSVLLLGKKSYNLTKYFIEPYFK